MGGKVTHENLLSNKLIRVKSLLEEDYEADVSSVRPPSSRLAKDFHSKRQLRYLFAGGIRLLSASLIQNFPVMFGKMTTFSKSSPFSHGVLIKQNKE